MSFDIEDNQQEENYYQKYKTTELPLVGETPEKMQNNENYESSYKNEMRTDDYLNTNINLESFTKSEFNLVEIKKELTDIKQKDILSQYYVKPFETIEEDIPEDKKQKNVELIIKQWLSLQKTIKEEITLEDVIIHQQTSDAEHLKQYFKSYYDLKLKKRKNFEDIKELNMGNNDYLNLPSFYITEENEKKLKDACEPIKNLLFILRDNYDYLIRLLSQIKQNDFSENRQKIQSIVELFNNQFYENILIPNPEQQELLILIYKLFEVEIMSMSSASPDSFLNNDSFLGIFLSSYSKRQEIVGYISMILNNIILYIDNQDKECIDTSITSIKRYLDKIEKEKKDKKDKKKEKELKDKKSSRRVSDFRMDFSKGVKALKEYLFGKIPKSKIKFKNNFELEAEKEKEYDIFRTNTGIISKDDNELCDPEQNVIIYRKLRRTYTDKSNPLQFKKEIEFNKDYLLELNQEKLLKKLKEERDGDLRDFYIKQIEQINNDSKKFTNEGILKILDTEKNEDLIENYKDNFLFIRKILDSLLQTIIDKIITLPYPLRCICKIIYLLISKKFPYLSTYSINTFIGKFLLNKCIFPVLKLEEKNVLDSRIFSSKTKKCLDVVIHVLSQANSGSLFNTYSDPEKTIFNPYLLEIIPILNKFYAKIIDVQLPKILDDLIDETSKKMEANSYKKIFNFRYKKKIKSEENGETLKLPDNNQMPPPLFNYFQENTDEIFHLESICFNTEDILFLIDLIGRDINKFNDLPKFTFFTKTYKRIKNETEILKNLIIEKNEEDETQRKPFFVIFKEEINTQLEKLMKQKKKDRSTFESSEQDLDLIFKRIKYCIKRILKGLNLLNNKDFAYLNFAQSTDKFFSALKYTLDELGEYSELSNDIPLKWYAQYISNYKKDLAEDYQKNDFSKLYEEIYTEETNILNELKSLSSIVITRDGMNLRCAEKIMEKMEYELKIVENFKKYIQIEKFIDSEKIEVCLMPNEGFNKSNAKNSEVSIPIPVILNDFKNCIHNGNSNERNPNHLYHIKDFISKFSYKLYTKDKHYKFRLCKLLKKDIEKGEKRYQINKIIENYLDFVKKQIKEPSNKKLFGEIKEDDVKQILEKIENHILRHIYRYVYPTVPIEKDIDFYKNTRKLEWIKPEHLEIKKLYVNQLKFAEKYIQKMDKSRTIYDKLDCINNAYVTMNNTVKFISGKNEDAGQDELTPLFQYILIKAHPQRLFTNVNYIKCLLSETDSLGSRGFYVSQMESASSFIFNINHEQLKMNQNEYDSKIKASLEKYNKDNPYKDNSKTKIEGKKKL